MLILGVVLLLVALGLIVFGFVGTAVQWVLWIGIVLVIVAIVLMVWDRARLRR